jgi:NAD(P) transhydrogenase subunit alpha
MREGGMLVDFIWPAQNPELMQQLAARKATVLAIDALPRQLSRAQKMDALTSMAASPAIARSSRRPMRSADSSTGR